MAEEASRWIGKGPSPAGVVDDMIGPPQSDAIGSQGTIRPRVLVVDDNADMREYLQRLLGERNEVELCTNGSEALQAIERQRPDVVLADVMMPGIDGFELLKRVRETPELRFMPIVLVTARAGEQAAIEGLLAGADDYIAKPFSPRELVARVRAVVERSRVEAALRASVSDARILATLGTSLIAANDPQAIYEQVIEAAVALTRSQFASLQLFHPSPNGASDGDGRLQLLAHRGFNEETEDFWKWVQADSSSSCGIVLQTGRRCVEPDVANSQQMGGGHDQQIYLAAGIRAVQSTPLLSRGGKLLGMISTHWDHPRWPSEAELHNFDILARQTADIIERRQAEETIRQNQKWLAGQKQALQTTLSGAPLAEPLAVLVNSSIERYGPTTRAAFYLADRDGKMLYHAVGLGPEYAQKSEGFPIGADSFAYGLAIHAGRPILTTDVRHEPLWQQWLWIAEDFDFRACGSFPLQTSEGKVLGTFAVYWREPHEFTPEDEAFANTVADTAAIIVARHIEAEERKRAEAALADELKAMTRLHALADRLMSITELQPALNEVLDAAIALHHADRGTMQFHDPVTDTLQYTACNGFDPQLLCSIPPIDRDFHSTCAVALRTNARVVATDLISDPQWAEHAPTASTLGYRAAISSLMKTRREELLGVLTVHFPHPHTPTEQELRWADLYARLAAHLVERSRAEAAVAEEFRYTKILQDLSARLVTEDSIQTTYEAILTAAIEVTRADAGTIQMIDEEAEELVVLATRGFSRATEEYFSRVDASSQTSCGEALKTGERSFIDFDPASTDVSIRMHVDDGLLSAQSSPLVSRSGKSIGMVSTHWRKIGHRPSERELRFLDLLARQAADVIERQMAEEALRASKERLRNILNSMAEGFALFGHDFTILDVNEETLRVDGRSRQELVGQLHWQAFPGTEHSALGEFFRRVMHQREPGNLEYHYDWPDGRAMWADVRAYPTPDGGVAVFWRDISERKRAEAALSENDAKYRTLFETIDEGFAILEVVFNDDGRLVDMIYREVNQSFERQSGLPAVVGDRISVVLPQLEQAWFEVYERVAKTGEPFVAEDYSADLDRWLRVRISRVGDAGSPFIVAVFEDVTDRKRAEIELRASEEKYRILFESIDDGSAPAT